MFNMQGLNEELNLRAIQSRRPTRTAVLEDRYVEAMKNLMPAQTNKNLSELFGIGYHTWVKLKSGVAVRASVVERIRLQLEAETASK